MHRRHSIGALSLTMLAAPLAAQQRQLPADSMGIARKYTMWFYTGQSDSLYAHFLPDLQKSMPREALLTGLAEMTVRAGTEVKVTEEKFITRNGARQYWRTADFTTLGEPFLLRWVIAPTGQIAGLGMGPKSQAPPIDPEK